MTFSADSVERVREIIRNLYTVPCTAASIVSAITATGELIGAEYNALFMNSFSDLAKSLIISNNPPGFLDIYRSVIREDFLIESVLDNGSFYVLRRDPRMDIPEHGRFIDAVQSARPISDVIYVPIKTGLSCLGYCGMARAGLSSPFYTDEEIDMFLFISSFVSDVVLRSLTLDPPPEAGAYIDYRGNLLYAGSGFETWTRENSALLPLIANAYRRFLHGRPKPGMDRLRLAVGAQSFTVRFRLLPSHDLRPRSSGAPFALAELTEHSVPVAADATGSALARLASAGLTPREREVVREMSRGFSNKNIALKLGIDESTVKRHTHNIYEKTGYASRVELLLGVKADL